MARIIVAESLIAAFKITKYRTHSEGVDGQKLFIGHLVPPISK